MTDGAEAGATVSVSPGAEQLRATIDAYNDAWNAHDVERIGSMHAPESRPLPHGVAPTLVLPVAGSPTRSCPSLRLSLPLSQRCVPDAP